MKENEELALKNDSSEDEKPKAILIGAAGHQGKEYFKILKEKLNFKALIDNNLELLEKYYDPKKYVLLPDISDLSTIDFDIALICLPHYLHKDITISLLSSNKIVIKEKPLGFNSSDVKDYINIIDEYSNYNLFTIVQRNFNPSFNESRNYLNTIGKIYNFSYDYELNFETQTTGWRAEYNKSYGGVLMDMGYHVLDIIFSFFKGLISVYAVNSFCYDNMKNEDLEDSINIIMKFENDISGTININRHSHLKKEIFTIRGDKGIMEIHPSQYIIYNRKGKIIFNKKYELNQDQIKYSMFDFYLNHINDKNFLIEHFKNHCNLVLIIEKIYRQLRKNN